MSSDDAPQEPLHRRSPEIIFTSTWSRVIVPGFWVSSECVLVPGSRHSYLQGLLSDPDRVVALVSTQGSGPRHGVECDLLERVKPYTD